MKNNAKLYDDNNIWGQWEKEVTVSHSNKLITKTPAQKSNSAFVTWTLNLNWGQSSIKNVALRDTVGTDAEGNLNQLIYKDSFKITQMDFSGTNSTPKKGTEHFAGGDLFDLVFNDSEDEDWTFEIRFKKPISKAYTLTYDSYYLGINGSNIENTAELLYKYSSGESSGESVGSDKKEYSAKFSYFGGAFTNKGQIAIEKKDKETGMPLKGAKFQLWNSAKDGIMIEEVITGEEGAARFSRKLGYLTYYLVEVQAPEFYDISSSEYKERKPVKLDSELKSITVENTKFKQAVELTKLAEHDGSLKLKEVKFILQRKEGESYVYIGEYTTDEDGRIYIDELQPGDYTFVEKATLPYYKLDEEPIEFKISQGQTEVKKIIKKNKKLGNLLIKKVDKADQALLKGAIFTLTDTEDSGLKYTSIPTGEDGIAKFENVEYGKYTLTETTMPDGYIGGEEVEITMDDLTNALINENYIAKTIENEKIYQAVNLTKIDAENGNLRLGGAIFELYEKVIGRDDMKVTQNAKGEDIGVLKTNATGNLDINNLSPGDYYFKEIKAPKYYELPDTKWEFTIESEQLVISEVTAKNNRKKGELRLEKVDSADDTIKLAGAEFTLSNKSGTITKTETKNEEGVIVFENLPYDTYTIIEVKAPDGYVLLTGTREVVFEYEDSGKLEVVTFENKKKNHSVILTKYNLNKTLKLEGAVFELRKEASLPGVYELITRYVIDKLSTNSNGVINLKDLEVGKYQLVEIMAPSGYRLDGKPVSFEIKENQTEPTQVEKLNERRPSDDGPGPGSGGGNPPDKEDPKEPEKPGDPKNPKGPADQDKPDDPSDQDNPKEPGEPGEPGEPDRPTEPATPAEPPKYRRTQTPDPTSPNSPDKFVLLDEDGVPLGTYTKQENSDGTFVYVDDDGIPLGTNTVPKGVRTVDVDPTPKTGDGMPVWPVTILFVVSLFGTIGLTIFKKKRYN